MLFAYYGVKQSETLLGKLVKTTVAKGSRAENLAKVGRQFGFDAYVKEMATFADIRRLVLKKKVPVIVNWFYEEDGHYSLVVGIDKKNIYLQDPTEGKVISYPLHVFMAIWFYFIPPYLTKNKKIFIRRMIVISPKGSL